MSEPVAPPADGSGADPTRAACFLSVVTRTQGRRPGLLAETLGSLAEQTDRDFEVLVVRHRTDPHQRAAVLGVVEALPSWLRERTRILDVERSGRSSPLNDGFAAAGGRYAAILDDDDLALPNWVAAFAALESEHPGKVLRTVAVRQQVRAESGPDGPMAVADGPADRIWPETFSFIDHLLVNSTPPVSVAFPITVFRDAGEQFDETLHTVEDWDFLMRAVGRVGIATSSEESSIYRWWVGDEGSRAEHSAAEWQGNEDTVRRKLDSLELILPPGSARRIKELVDGLTAERDREAANARQLLGEAQDYLARLTEAEERIRRQRAKLQRLRGDRGD